MDKIFTGLSKIAHRTKVDKYNLHRRKLTKIRSSRKRVKYIAKTLHKLQVSWWECRTWHSKAGWESISIQ